MSASDALERAPTRIDLRKRVRRETADRLVALAAHLPTPDRLLVEAVFREQRTLAELAEMLHPEAASGEAARLARRQLSRRLRRLVERLSSPAYQAAAAGLAAGSEGWTAPQRRVAIACVLHGLTQREAATRLGLSLHTVRSHHRAVLAMCASAWKGVRR